MKVMRCDNCGRESVHVYRFTGEARDAAWECNRDWFDVDISVEHNEDIFHADLCSLTCLADWALKRAAEQMAQVRDE